MLVGESGSVQVKLEQLNHLLTTCFKYVPSWPDDLNKNGIILNNNIVFLFNTKKSYILINIIFFSKPNPQELES